jgi:hypothetical protein
VNVILRFDCPTILTVARSVAQTKIEAQASLQVHGVLVIEAKA